MMQQTKLGLVIIAYFLLIALSQTFVVNVPTCTSDKKPNLTPFTYTTNGTVDNTTEAHICHDGQFLYVTWFNFDEEVIANYSKCNDPLYNADAV